MNAAVRDRRLFEALAEARAPRYTSYPTAVQFGPQVDARTQARWLAAIPGDAPISVYVHIPYCKRLCWYCGCNMQVARRPELVSDYVAQLDREIGLVRRAVGRMLPVSTLHLGGGSPDCLSSADLDALFVSLRSAFRLSGALEFDVEIDPAHVGVDFIAAAARRGLTRASLGVQTFAPHVQEAIHRPQSFERVAEVVAELRRVGVESLNFDLMYGLPGQSVSDVLATLDQALALQPSRIALFGYAHMPSLKVHQRLIDSAALPNATERLDQAEAAADWLAAAGYRAIGLDHYALPEDPLARAAEQGTLHRNFQGYTTDAAETLIGLGVSAISKLPQGYAQNAYDLEAWSGALAEGRLAAVKGVAVTGDDRLRGEIIERLMCDGRVDVAALCRRHGVALDAVEPAWERLLRFEDQGLVQLDGARVQATDKGRLLIRTLCTAFDRYYDATAGRYSRAI
jgi:oxygen-independent coproporphyrinogen III oxidase